MNFSPALANNHSSPPQCPNGIDATRNRTVSPGKGRIHYWASKNATVNGSMSNHQATAAKATRRVNKVVIRRMGWLRFCPNRRLRRHRFSFRYRSLYGMISDKYSLSMAIIISYTKQYYSSNFLHYLIIV